MTEEQPRRRDVRKPPLSPHKASVCGWCDEPVPKKFKKNGEPYRYQPQWHRDCAAEYMACSNPSRFFDDLVERDGLRCNVCGEAPHGWEPKKRPDIAYFWDSETNTAAEYCIIEWRPLLDVDHVIPLWKVRDLQPAKRREYFKLPNLQLLCRGDAGYRCHQIKSAKEAAERAHYKNLCGETKKGRGEKPKRSIPSRPFKRPNASENLPKQVIPSRPFPKQQRPMGKRKGAA